MHGPRDKEARVWRPPTAQDTPSTSEASDFGTSVEQLKDWWVRGNGKKKATGLLGWMSDVTKLAVDQVSEHFDTDRALQHATGAAIELAGNRYAMGEVEQWSPGQPLKLLLAGYNGTRNTGADVRVEEMIRQFRHLFGDDDVELSVLTIEPALTRGYFRTCRQLHLPKIYPKFLYDTIHKHHGVIACEGSMFKSKFANALSTMMVGSLGMAGVEQKLAVGYGGEAGQMDRSLRDFVARYAKDALVICRNTASQKVLTELGVETKFGTDTAWTFEPPKPEIGETILRDHGWDGKTPVLAVCPINAFWWPVKPDLARAAMNKISNIDADLHYGSVYFHADGPLHAAKQEHYIHSLAEAIQRFEKDHDVFIVLAGSEQLDRSACDALNEELGADWPIIVSDEHNMFEMVSVLRCASMMLSSRYHAIVITMPASVPSAGVTMDERIANLMDERGQDELCMRVDDEDLADRAYAALLTLHNERQSVVQGIERCVVANLERMGAMGQTLVEHVRLYHPEFPFKEGLGEEGDAWDHLPTLSPRLQALIEKVKR